MAMRIVRLTVLAAVLGSAATARATNFDSVDFTCPLCDTTFASYVLVSSSSYGSTDEGRPLDIGASRQKARIHTCPKCRYTALGWGFKGGSDAPGAKQVGAIRTALAARTGHLKSKTLPWRQRVELCLLCYRNRKPVPFGLVSASMLGAWLSDDHGATEDAAAYRRQTLQAARAFLADPAGDDPYQAVYVRYLAGLMSAKFGQYAQAVKFFDDFFAVYDKGLKTLARQEKKAEEQFDRWEKHPQPWRDEHTDEFDRLQEQLYDIERTREVIQGMGMAAYRQRGRAMQRSLGEQGARKALAKAQPHERMFFIQVFGRSDKAETIAAVIAALKDKDDAVRLAAANALAGRSRLAPGSIKPLIIAMDDGAPGVGVAAVDALAIGWPPSPEVIAALVRATTLRDWHVREAAVTTLGRLGLTGPEVAKAIIVCLKDDGPAVAVAAAITLGRLGSRAPGGIDALVASLKHGEHRVREQCAKALAEIGPKVVPLLRAALRQKNDKMRAYAARALGEIGPAAAEAAGELLATMKGKAHKGNHRRHEAARALQRIGVTHNRFISALADGVSGDDIYLHETALAVLADIGPPAKAATAAVLVACKSPNWLTRESAVKTLSAICTEPKVLMPVLMKALEDKEQLVRDQAVAALVKLGPAAKPAAPRLVKLLQLGGANDRNMAARILGAIGPVVADQAVGPLIEILKNDKELTHLHAEVATALGRMGPAAGGAVGLLIGALGHEDHRLRLAAARALGQMGPVAVRAAGPLTRLFKDELLEVAEAAAHSLGRIGPLPEEVLPVLVKATTGEGTPVRIPAAQSLIRLGHRAEGIGVLRAVLADRDEELAYRARAAAALAESTARDERTLAALKATARHTDRNLAVAAAIALVKLGQPDAALPTLGRYVSSADKTDENWHLDDALDAVARLGPKADTLAPHLVRLLERDVYPGLRKKIAKALISLGPSGRKSVEALRTHRDWRIRRLANHVLQQIGKGP